MKLSRDYIKEYTEAAEANATEDLITIFFELCNEIGLKAEPDLSEDQVKSISIATLFNEKAKGQNGKPL